MSAPNTQPRRIAALAVIALAGACGRHDASRPDIRDPAGGQHAGEQRIGNSAPRTDRVRMSGGDRGYADPQDGVSPESAAALPARTVDDPGALSGVGYGDATRAASRRGRESVGSREMPRQQAARESGQP